ncbi:tRNA m5C-methyltransferase, putative [Plasmodium sp. DRC-Itaito]|nr:tRNA m5C-methyltransferase, putative [Plasmodium sp. DRC-Itaito]
MKCSGRVGYFLNLKKEYGERADMLLKRLKEDKMIQGGFITDFIQTDYINITKILLYMMKSNKVITCFDGLYVDKEYQKYFVLYENDIFNIYEMNKTNNIKDEKNNKISSNILYNYITSNDKIKKTIQNDITKNERTNVVYEHLNVINDINYNNNNEENSFHNNIINNMHNKNTYYKKINIQESELLNINDIIKYDGSIENVEKIIYYLNPCSILCAYFLDINKNEHVLDMCASPGGKSLYIVNKLFGYNISPLNRIKNLEIIYANRVDKNENNDNNNDDNDNRNINDDDNNNRNINDDDNNNRNINDDDNNNRNINDDDNNNRNINDDDNNNRNINDDDNNNRNINDDDNNNRNINDDDNNNRNINDDDNNNRNINDDDNNNNHYNNHYNYHYNNHNIYNNAKNFLVQIDCCMDVLNYNKINREGFLVINEYNKVRYERLKKVLDKYIPSDLINRSSNIHITNYNGLNINSFMRFPKFHKILLDVPCSTDEHLIKQGTKELNKWSINFIKNNSDTQLQLLINAFALLHTGGVIIYSTCALSYLENDNVIEKFHKKYKNNIEIIDFIQEEYEKKISQYLSNSINEKCNHNHHIDKDNNNQSYQYINHFKENTCFLKFFEKTRYGYISLPDRSPFGILYICKIKKI